MRLFDRLNTPMVVVSVLGVVVALNGLLLLNRYAGEPADSPTPTEIQDEQANSTTGATSPETTAGREETTTPPPEPRAEREPRAEPEREPRDEPREEPRPEREPEREPRPEPEREPRPEREPEREPRPEPRDQGAAPPANVPQTVEEAIEGCGTTEAECMSAYVAGIAPLATYVEDVPDANSAPSESNRLFYFRDPILAPCQYSWGNYTFGNGVTYTVIVYGEGSFDENGSGCIPAF